MQQTIAATDVSKLSVFLSLQRLDRVRLGNGQIMIVTGYHPNRPMNCWSGVLENGKGKGYIFGRKHRPVKLGVVGEDHPALVANQDRGASKGNDPIAGGDRLAVTGLLNALEANDQGQVKLMTGILRANGF